MIPDREDQCSAPRAPSTPTSTLAFGPSDQERYNQEKQQKPPTMKSIRPQQQQREQLEQREQNQQHPQHPQHDETAWSRYWRFAESMKSRGQIFDRKLLLEAMFRGNDLVYSTS